MRRARFYPLIKPWRRRNLFPPSISIPRGAPRNTYSVGMCGITFEKFQDIKEGDIVEAFLMEQIEV